MRQEAFDRNSRVRPDSVEFAVILLSTGGLIGFGGLFDITRAMTATLFADIGERDLWRRGYGTEATRLICEYGFFFRSLHNIRVEVNGYNQRAIRLYERLGFRLLGRVREALLFNGAATTRSLRTCCAPNSTSGTWAGSVSLRVARHRKGSTTPHPGRVEALQLLRGQRGAGDATGLRSDRSVHRDLD
jgi:Acetyltransferase (GNAT) domain